MALKSKLTAEEHGKLVPDLQASYKKLADGSYVLDVEGIDDLSDLAGALDRVKAEVKKARDEATAARAQAEKYKDIDPEKYKELLAAAEDADRKAKEGKGEYDKIIAQMNEKHAQDLANKDKKIAAITAALESHLIEASAIAAIAEFKGEPALLLPIIRKRTKVVENNGEYTVQVLGDDGSPQVDGTGKALSIKSLVEQMKGDKVYGRAFEANGQSGGGAPPNPRPGNGPAGGGGPARTSQDKIKAGLEKAGMV